MGEQAGLIARIRQIRRTAEVSDPAPRTVALKDDATVLQDLTTRLEHLEQLVEALQDSVHRESARQSKRLMEFEARLEPAALSVALSNDARQRGL